MNNNFYLPNTEEQEVTLCQRGAVHPLSGPILDLDKKMLDRVRYCAERFLLPKLQYKATLQICSSM